MSVVVAGILIWVNTKLIFFRELRVSGILTCWRERAIIRSIVSRHIVGRMIVDATVQLIAAPTLGACNSIPLHTVVDTGLMGVLVEFGIVDKDETVLQMREFKPGLGLDRTCRILVVVGDNSRFVIVTVVRVIVGTVVAATTTG
jgi:hypothetical protein